ncbi:hypothetical protein U1Q18_000460 [Sarracenia purpurea var. burkii]
MGNCIRKEPPTQWGGEDWGSPEPEMLFSGDRSQEIRLYDDKPTKIEKECLSLSSTFSSPCSFPGKSAEAAGTEVKIRITKKQLEELLGTTDVRGLSVHQVLELLMSAGDRYETDHQRSWRPALQSIPEVN